MHSTIFSVELWETLHRVANVDYAGTILQSFLRLCVIALSLSQPASALIHVPSAPSLFLSLLPSIFTTTCAGKWIFTTHIPKAESPHEGIFHVPNSRPYPPQLATYKVTNLQYRRTAGHTPRSPWMRAGEPSTTGERVSCTRPEFVRLRKNLWRSSQRRALRLSPISSLGNYATRRSAERRLSVYKGFSIERRISSVSAQLARTRLQCSSHYGVRLFGCCEPLIRQVYINRLYRKSL